MVDALVTEVTPLGPSQATDRAASGVARFSSPRRRMYASQGASWRPQSPAHPTLFPPGPIRAILPPTHGGEVTGNRGRSDGDDATRGDAGGSGIRRGTAGARGGGARTGRRRGRVPAGGGAGGAARRDRPARGLRRGGAGPADRPRDDLRSRLADQGGRLPPRDPPAAGGGPPRARRAGGDLPPGACRRPRAGQLAGRRDDPPPADPHLRPAGLAAPLRRLRQPRGDHGADLRDLARRAAGRARRLQRPRLHPARRDRAAGGRAGARPVRPRADFRPARHGRHRLPAARRAPRAHRADRAGRGLRGGDGDGARRGASRPARRDDPRRRA